MPSLLAMNRSRVKGKLTDRKLREHREWQRPADRKLDLREPHLMQVKTKYCIIFPVAFSGMEVWQESTTCGGKYKKHPLVSPPVVCPTVAC